MDLSLNWLNDHVDLSGIDPAEIAHELTMRTALIEGWTDQRAALAGVVVGEVLECGPHPGADRLRVCKGDAGDGGEPAHVRGERRVRLRWGGRRSYWSRRAWSQSPIAVSTRGSIGFRSWILQSPRSGFSAPSPSSTSR